MWIFPILNFPGPLFDMALNGNPEDGGVKGNVFPHLGNTETRWKQVTKHPVVLAQCWQVRFNILIIFQFRFATFVGVVQKTNCLCKKAHNRLFRKYGLGQGMPGSRGILGVHRCTNATIEESGRGYKYNY